MSIFKKNKNDGLGKKPFEEFEGSEKSRDVLKQPYSPENYLITKEYEIPSVLVRYKVNFDQRVRDYVRKTSPDEFNTTIFDAEISMIEAEAQASLALQRTEHVCGQLAHMETTWKMGKKDYNAMKAHHEKELKEVEAEIAAYKSIVYKGTPLAGPRMIENREEML